jgi:CBS domain containing-hemolysin-like protein/mannitol/fructose-specific phosphotransferase system IIA component
MCNGVRGKRGPAKVTYRPVTLPLLGIGLVLLLAANAFFVLAEFAMVKVRPSRITELAATGNKRATLVGRIQEHLDEYLSVCQVGITLASVALGMVGEKTAEIFMGTDDGNTVRYGLAISASYLLVSGSHILLGELVPKSIAIRITEPAALWTALPLRLFHVLFFPALWLMTHLANAILRPFRLAPSANREDHSEGELRIILDQSQERGLMSFRRLLFMENVFDLGALTVRDAMRQRSQVRTLDARAPWSENLRIIQTSHFTRYPLITTNPARPTGFVHVKDLVIQGDCNAPALAALARSLLATVETTPLETLFAEMQRRRIHMALVANDHGQWTGLITLEDVIEELVGTIRDEFEDEEPVSLSEALTVDRIHFDIEANSAQDAVRVALARTPTDALPLKASRILQPRRPLERLAGTYLGDGIGMPHARITGLSKPVVMILRSKDGVHCDGTSEKAQLLFVLLTPAGQPRVHQRLQSIIAGLLQESEFVKERLMTATSADEVLEVIRTGEQAALD